MIADIYNCEKLCICCYHHLLEDFLQYDRVDYNFTKSVGEIASEHPADTIIIRVDSHLTMANDGQVLDIWDCTDELVDCIWIVS